MNTLKVALSLWVLVTLVQAQTVQRGSWEAVTGLRAEQKLRVHPFEGDEVRGALVSATADTLVIQTKSSERTLRRADVREVKVAKTGRRGRNAAIGGGIGAAVGCGVGLLALVATGGSDSAGQILGQSCLAGAALGLGLGLIPSGYATVYEARR